MVDNTIDLTPELTNAIHRLARRRDEEPGHLAEILLREHVLLRREIMAVRADGPEPRNGSTGRRMEEVAVTA